MDLHRTQLTAVMQQMIQLSSKELDDFLAQTLIKTFRKQEILNRPGAIPNEIFFVTKGIIRVLVTDNDGVDHTLHFALENQFITDYSCFLLKQPSLYSLQAVEETEVVILPRATIEWGYKHLAEGNKLGRLIAEFYFIYQDNRIKNLYARTPKERYDSITDIFPDIHNRVPQHMIASYLGISAVHLSRLKKEK
jgi:CRP-like cAMP-binding protein